VDSSGNAVVSESGGNVTLGNVRLPSSGGIKDSSGNNILSESGGVVTLNNGTIGSGVVLDNVHPSSGFYLSSAHSGNARIDDWVLETGTGSSGEGSSVAFNSTSDYFYFPVTGVYILYYSFRTYTAATSNDNQINIKTVISNDQGTTADVSYLSTNSFNEDPINGGDAYYSITGSVLVNVVTAGDTASSTVLYLETDSFTGVINPNVGSRRDSWCYFYRISNT
jgi:hypothetical protein